MPNFVHFILFWIFSYQSSSAPFPSFLIKVVQNDLECLILVISHFFSIFSYQSGIKTLEHPMLVVLHLFQCLPTKVVKNYSECPDLVFPFFSPIFSHQSGLKLSEMIVNAQFGLFCTFPHIFPLKWPKIIWKA